MAHDEIESWSGEGIDAGPQTISDSATALDLGQVALRAIALCR
jgi:hypothetical protein